MTPWHLKVKESNQKLASLSAIKKSARFINLFSNTADLRVSWTKIPLPLLTRPTQRSFSQLLASLNFDSIQKISYSTCSFWMESCDRAGLTHFYHTHPITFWSAFSFCDSWDTPNFIVQRPDWPYSFLTMPNQKIFNQLLIFVNLYQHPKNEAVSSIFSGETVDLKIL